MILGLQGARRPVGIGTCHSTSELSQGSGTQAGHRTVGSWACELPLDAL